MLKQGSLYFENTYIPSTNFVDRIQRKLHTATVFQNLIMGLGIYDFENTVCNVRKITPFVRCGHECQNGREIPKKLLSLYFI